MTRWIGRWLMVLGTLHVILGLGLHYEAVSQMLSAGLFDSLRGDPRRVAAFWFVLGGPLLVMLGAVTSFVEGQNHGRVPRSLGVLLFLTVAAAIFVEPRGGWWLYLPPAIGALFRPIRREQQEEVGRAEALLFRVGGR